MENNIKHINAYKRKTGFNVGIVIFGITFIYIFFNILIFLTNKHVTIYEVREGSVYRDTSYTGFIHRSEVIVNTDREGYVNYFASEGSKVGVRTRVYASSNEKLDFTNTSDEEGSLSEDEKTQLYGKVGSFASSYNSVHFDDVYLLKDTIASAIDNKSNQSRGLLLDQMLQNGAEGLDVYNSAVDGVISYSIDGYENIDLNSLTEDIMEKKNYKKNVFKNNEKLSANQPVYKILNSDYWEIYIPLSEEEAKEYSEKKTMKITFVKDGTSATASFSTATVEDAYYGILSFDKGMTRYFNERYLDIELVLEDVTGLKIPKTSVVEKEFYVVPKDFITQGGNSKSDGVLVDTQNGNPEFVSVKIYGENQEDGTVYLDMNSFSKTHSTLIKTDSDETYKLRKTTTMKGVYNINKGYSVFNKIDILTESDDYYIVKSGSNYGLSNYDHIALDGKTTKENDVVF
ncbi:hypothetical protein M2454_001465 [Aequitasia blattaphilus]|uniref:RND related barrel-sandwich hybrid domain-containing protein n=1 Tax=Aequitasia blattaphilus TaxID=2949332 RepID=A0ABT1E794_9FIRM|nr:HlyD family efflux transporter periplasmic adaptor subunit [Aequitasia blattaphilus]MCP1101700.1 hypothetical protein [Aequitasia blattaphilus]MCR8614340.1 hypothetical protein [Aequitasia blattaphilus]